MTSFDELAELHMDYEQLKALAAHLGRPVSTLYALSGSNDPFYAGSPSRRRGAEWFAALWREKGLGSGVHLRRVHYLLVSQAEPVLKWDGTPYQNTEGCWADLIRASGDARYLGLVPIEAFVDRRNSEPVIYIAPGELASLNIADSDAVGLGLAADFPPIPRLTLAAPRVAQRYAVELWAEKTTMNDVLLPLAPTLGLNVVTGAGELSITACHGVVARARQHGRPVRILYVSDFDPAGLSMPLAVARKIEHMIHQDPSIDVQVRPIVLTAEQCATYNLPRTPIKETERRAASFEARNGEGATELDALEALHPGLLRRILLQEIGRYYDAALHRRVAAKASEIEEDLDVLNARVAADHRDELDALREGWSEIADSIGEWQARAEAVWQAIADDLEASAPDLSTVAWPEPREGDEDPDPLFDSRRTYLQQIDRFKRHQGRPTGRRRVASGGAVASAGAKGRRA